MTTTDAATTPATSSLRIVDDLVEARATILKRTPLGEPVLGEAVQSAIDELWGAPTSPAEHVRQIIAAVEAEGDAAVKRFSQAFDGSSYEAVEVSGDEIAEAYTKIRTAQYDAMVFAVQRV